MARTIVNVDAQLDDAWTALQSLATWEGVAGIEDLHEAQYDGNADLVGFRFAMDTAVGRVSGRARVDSTKPVMTIQASQKGLEITLRVSLIEASGKVQAHVDARSKASSFLNKPLELTLNALLDNSIRDEAAKISSRIS